MDLRALAPAALAAAASAAAAGGSGAPNIVVAELAAATAPPAGVGADTIVIEPPRTALAPLEGGHGAPTHLFRTLDEVLPIVAAADGLERVEAVAAGGGGSGWVGDDSVEYDLEAGLHAKVCHMIASRLERTHRVRIAREDVGARQRPAAGGAAASDKAYYIGVLHSHGPVWYNIRGLLSALAGVTVCEAGAAGFSGTAAAAHGGPPTWQPLHVQHRLAALHAPCWRCASKPPPQTLCQLPRLLRRRPATMAHHRRHPTSATRHPAACTRG